MPENAQYLSGIHGPWIGGARLPGRVTDSALRVLRSHRNWPILVQLKVHVKRHEYRYFL